MSFFEWSIAIVMLLAFILFILAYSFGEDIRKKFFCLHKWKKAGQMSTFNSNDTTKLPTSVVATLCCELCGKRIQEEL